MSNAVNVEAWVKAFDVIDQFESKNYFINDCDFQSNPASKNRPPATPNKASFYENMDSTTDLSETHEEFSADLYADLDDDSSRPVKFNYSVFA